MSGAFHDVGADARAVQGDVRPRATKAQSDDGGGFGGTDGSCRCSNCRFFFRGLVQDLEPGRRRRVRVYADGFICQLHAPVTGKPPAATEPDRVCSCFTNACTGEQPLKFALPHFVQGNAPGIWEGGE